MTPKELAEKIWNQIDPGDEQTEFVRKIEPLLRFWLGHEKQEWNKRCNEACQKQIEKIWAAENKKNKL